MSRRAGYFAATMALSFAALGFRAPHVVVEASGHEGQSHGAFGCGCGPLYRARHAGGGAGITVAQREARDGKGEGAYVRLRGTMEREHVALGNPDCTSSPSGTDPRTDVRNAHCEPEDRVVPGARTMYAADARIGFGTEHLRIDAGLLAYQGYRDNADPAPTTRLWPSAELRYRDGPWRAIFGIGAPFLSTLRRPALSYYGWGYMAPSGFGFDVVLGQFRSGPTVSPLQGNLGTLVVQGAIPMGRHLALKPGANVGCYHCLLIGLPPDFSVSLGLRLSL